MGSDPEWKSVFVGGVVNGDPGAVRRALDLGMSLEAYSFAAGTKNPLLEAVRNWDRAGPEVIATLLAAGANVDGPIMPSDVSRQPIDEGRTALMLAANRGWLALVKQLLAAGADPNLQAAPPLCDTALSVAASCEEKPPQGRKPKRTDPDPVAVVRELLTAGAKPNVWALESAVSCGQAEIARLFLAAGVDVNGKGPGGTTPLHQAVGGNKPELVAVLMAAGADPNIPFPNDHGDFPGLTCLDVARKRRKKLVPLLES
ncbi:MAG TPA: ankyrin repeat domain-containing protein [Gemmata sp.]